MVIQGIQFGNLVLKIQGLITEYREEKKIILFTLFLLVYPLLMFFSLLTILENLIYK